MFSGLLRTDWNVTKCVFVGNIKRKFLLSILRALVYVYNVLSNV